MTDIREQAAKAARERATRGQRPDIDLGPGDIMLIEALTEMYLSGHAAGVADGARAFAEWLDDNYDEVISHSGKVAIFLAAQGTGLALFQAAPPDDDGGVPDPDMEDDPCEDCGHDASACDLCQHNPSAEKDGGEGA